MKGLEEWVRLYTSLTGIVDPQQASYLKRTADTAKQFKANFDALSKHLETPRPGEKGFPGANVEQWQRYLTESYSQLLAVGPPAAPALVAPAPAAPATTAGAAPPPLPALPPPSLPGGTIAPTFHPAAQTRVNTSRLQELIGRLQVDSANLGAQKSGFAFLLDETTTPGKTKLANPTVLVSVSPLRRRRVLGPRCLPGERRREDPGPGEHDLLAGRQEAEARRVAEAAGGPEERVRRESGGFREDDSGRALPRERRGSLRAADRGARDSSRACSPRCRNS